MNRLHCGAILGSGFDTIGLIVQNNNISDSYLRQQWCKESREGHLLLQHFKDMFDMFSAEKFQDLDLNLLKCIWDDVIRVQHHKCQQTGPQIPTGNPQRRF